MSHVTSFAFRAVRHDGTVEAGVVEAGSREAAAALIAGRGAFPIRLAPGGSAPVKRNTINAEDLAAGLRALATLLATGTPLARTLSILQELVPPGWHPVLPILRERIEHGGGLAAALEGSRLPLPTHIIGIIRAGEAGSGLAPAVATSAELLERGAATRAALRNALAYPVMLAVTGTASVSLLVGMVLPRFVTLLADTRAALPLSTRLVLGAGSLFHAAFLPGVVFLALAAAIWRVWVSDLAGLTRWHELLRAAPFVGALRRSTAAAHATSALAALLRAGVPLATALPHAARASGDRAVELRLLAARERIQKGAGVSAALEAEDALTPAVVRLARVGEQTGQLATMLAHAAGIESHHAAERLRRLIRLVEPLLILLFGGVVMLVAAALFQAMYGLRPAF